MLEPLYENYLGVVSAMTFETKATSAADLDVAFDAASLAHISHRVEFLTRSNRLSPFDSKELKEMFPLTETATAWVNAPLHKRLAAMVVLQNIL